MKKEKSYSQYRLIALVSLFFIFFDNFTFFKKVLEVYPWSLENIPFILSLAVVLFALLIFIFTLVSSKWTTKPLLILALLISSLSAYFMESFHVVIDDSMIQNLVQTNLDESMDLLSLKQVLYFIFLGLLPSYWVYRQKIDYFNLKTELLKKLKYLGLSLLIIVSFILIFSKFYASFLREHKPLRFYTNPSYWIYNTGKFIGLKFTSPPAKLKEIGLDAHIPKERAKQLTIMVVGEASRFDRWSLNGYKKETNPLLKKENIINLSEVSSCGTSTAESVPCMFSFYEKSNYSYNKGISTENVLDVLKHTNDVAILWRDNNSDSKGVALRVDYQNFKSASTNTICDVECRDEGMLMGLDEYIKQHKNKNILIVLHQMGNHGPAYYKRYPKTFEKFTPVCKTNQLEDCTQEEISNTYDNAILYTDYFLSKTINFLKSYQSDYKTSLIYMADHGESLGEHGIYLHGLPYFMAPEAQTHVASLLWFGKGNEKKIDGSKAYSQDNLFHTLLGNFGVETKLYKKEMDILNVH